MSNILIKKEKSVSVCELWNGDENIRCVVLVGGLVAWVNAGEKSVLWMEGGGGWGFDHLLSFPRRESLRRAHIDQTLEFWDFGELCVLNIKVKSKEALAST